jgi:hypothetical protein
VGAGVEGVDVVWVGATVVFAAVDEEDVGAPEGRRVAAAGVGGGGGGGGEGLDDGPGERMQVEAVDVVVD